MRPNIGARSDYIMFGATQHLLDFSNLDFLTTLTTLTTLLYVLKDCIQSKL